MRASDYNTQDSASQKINFVSWVWVEQHNTVKAATSPRSAVVQQNAKRSIDLLRPLRQYLDSMDVSSAKLARQICKLIPAQCPFERDVTLFGRTILHIPPLCKLNPVYDEVVGLRFRALCYLADECGEDVTPYC